MLVDGNIFTFKDIIYVGTWNKLKNEITNIFLGTVIVVVKFNLTRKKMFSRLSIFGPLWILMLLFDDDVGVFEGYFLN